MLFLSVYTPAKPASGPPSAERMANMMALIEEMSQAGVLVTTGGIMSRQTAMKVSRKGNDYSVAEGPIAGSSLMPAAGFALLKVNSRDEVIKHSKRFLEVAGDGTSEIIQVMDGAPEKAK